jgi:malonyl CoA-acyl carrier protein transacylase
MIKTEKERRNAIKRQIKNQEKENILNSLPISVDKINELFDYLDEQLGEYDCDDTLNLTVNFIEENSLPKDSLISWLNENGGYCDCEVIANIEEIINE